MNASGRQLILGTAIAGLVLLLFDTLVLHRTSPSAATFTCWFLCGKLFLARYARHCPPFWAAGFGGLLLLAALALRWDTTRCMAVALVALFALTLSVPADPVEQDAGLRASLLASARSFVGYLPHVAAGVLLSYADRFAALHFYAAGDSEFYLRLMQLASLAAFVAYPLVYVLRNGLIARQMAPSAPSVAALGTTLAATIGALFVAAFIAMEWLRRSHSLQQREHWQGAALLMVLATVLSQLYQVTSMRIFIARRYGFINRGTMLAAALAATVAALVALGGASVWWLALAPVAGWGMTCWRVLLYFHRERTAPAAAAAVLERVEGVRR
jgi:hypothetical protein